jgi:hypothetical protein
MPHTTVLPSLETRPNTPAKQFTSPISAPSLYGIRYTPLAPNERVTGTVVVSATHLSGQLLDNPNGYHWTLQYPQT